MCGINLLLDQKKSIASDEIIRRMSETTRHRGPDHSACITIETARKHIFIANNRLKILDLSGNGNQPMQCGLKGGEGNRFTLSYNGELYNHFELKNELLQKGYTFRSTSDTEVLLYALAEWGETLLPRLQGMFAFVFYDQAQEQLLIARDSQGMKPLYYFSNDDFLVVSSEIRGVLASRLVEKKLNESQVFHYLQFRYAQKPQTFYQNIYELLPGHHLSYGTNRKEVEEKSYLIKNKPVEASFINTSSIVEKVEEKLTDALFNHLQADRPTGIFLSGGVDSTLMLALLRNNGSYQIPDCFTIVNSEKEASWGTEDYLWAERAAKKYDARHFPLEVGSSILSSFDSFLSEQDQPIGDSAAWLTSFLAAKASKKQVNVVLSGAGADELFGGYNRHTAFYSYLQHYSKIKPLLPLLRPIGNALPASRLQPLRKLLRLWKKILTEMDPSPSQTFLNFLSFRILKEPTTQQLEKEEGDFKEGWMMAALKHERENYLISDILALNDKACMQHGVEMRMPYLSQEVWELASKLPANLLMKNGPKWILSEILNKNGAPDIVKRKKEGFGLPFGLWVKEGKTDFMWEWLNDKNSPLLQYLDKNIIEQLLHQHKNGKEDLSQELFSIAVLGNWLAKEFS